MKWHLILSMAVAALALDPFAAVACDDVEREFVGVSERRSFEAALSDALRQMDKAVRDQGKFPCSLVTWRVVEIRGKSGSPAGLNTLEVKLAASFETRTEPVWGEPGPNLRMGIAIRGEEQVKIGDLWQWELRLQNTGDHPQEFVGKLQDLVPQAAGQAVGTADAPGSRSPDPSVRVTLGPGEIKTIFRSAVRLRPLEERGNRVRPAEPTMFIAPGRYQFRPMLRFHFLMVPEETHEIGTQAVQVTVTLPGSDDTD